MHDPTAGFRVHAVIVGQRFTSKELDEERLINMDGNGVGTVVLLETRSPPVARDPIEVIVTFSLARKLINDHEHFSSTLASAVHCKASRQHVLPYIETT